MTNKNESTTRVKHKEQVRRRNAKIIRRRIMIAAAAAVVVIALIIFFVCRALGVFESIPEYSEVTVEEDGSILCQEVSDFSSDAYDSKELKTFVKEEIGTYNTEVGSEAVTLERVKVSGDTAYVRTTYAADTDYAHFTGIWFDVTTMSEATEAGYEFADAFVAVSEGTKGDSVDTLDITSQTDLSVLVIRENITVTVPGEILYVSDGCTTMVDSDTVTIAQPDGNEDATQLTYIIYQ